MNVSCTQDSTDKISLSELNSENLELLAIKNSPDDTVRKYVLDRIKTKHSKEYYPIINDKEKVETLINKYTQEIKLSASHLSAKTNFLMRQNVEFRDFDANSSSLILKNFLLGSSLPISTNKLTDDGMPANFLLLIPNVDMMNNFKVNSKQFQELINSRQNQYNKSLYMEIIVNLVKFQNLDNFQTVIKEVNIYESENKSILLTTKTETKTTQELTDDWLLSDGYTNKLIGIHAFSFFGYRLQDLMRTVNTIKDTCKKTQKLGMHQVVVCNRPYEDNIIIATTYIGGIMAKIDLLAQSKLNKKDIKIIKQKIRMNLKQPKSIFSKEHFQWEKYGVDFHYYSDAINGTKSEQSKYSYEFGTSEKYKNLDLTIIISMISHDTKNLIEENR